MSCAFGIFTHIELFVVFEIHITGHPVFYQVDSLIAQLVKNPTAVQETPVQFLGWEDPLEKGMLPTPVFWPGESHGLYSLWGLKESDTTEQLSPYFPSRGRTYSV